MKRTFKIGTGITAREITALETRDDFRRFGAAWNRSLKEGGFFGAVSEEANRTCQHIMSEATGDEYEQDCPEYFAHLIAKYIRVSKGFIEKGNADQAARFGFLAGLEWARATMKWAWEPDALRGEKVAGGERNAAHQTNERHMPERERRLARMRELVPTMGVEGAAAQCEVEGIAKRSAVKQTWYRHRKKRDT